MLTTFLNVEGLLGRDFRLDVQRAEESRFRLKTSGNAATSAVVAELRDAQGVLLLRQACEYRFPEGCAPPLGLGTPGWLRVSLPRHPESVEMLLTMEGRTLWRSRIGGTEPEVTLRPVSVGSGKVTVGFDVSPPGASIQATLIDESGRAYPVERAREGAITVDLAPFSGAGRSRLRVQATHELRSAFTDSDSFDTPVPRVSGRILAPRRGEELAADHAVTLMGNLSNSANGRPYEWRPVETRWVVDGVEIQESSECLAIDALPPGRHVVSLQLGSGANARELHQVVVQVRAPSAMQKELGEAMKRVDEAGRRRVSAPVPASMRAAGRSKRRSGVHAPCKCC